MRKHQQRQILQVLKTIEQAQSEGLYADCQAGAVAAGSFIESIVGEGTETVALLEEYCELLFRASKGEMKEKHLRKHLIKIENSVTSELKPDRIEMVFLSYKVSMSDSFESIYLTAKNDSDCEAYMIAIPSYELNSDGTLGKMYYDGDQYPDHISIVDWQSYDIEARHPDVIFTHYAYDDNVNNATIHPNFYSKRLREHCELLVYIPYFVAPGDTVDEYCGYLPGVLYAHYVIVQSEAVRQSYIGHYKKFDKEFAWKDRFGKAKEKFLALGSPKFDKVINTRREDYELPLEWKRLIYKSDGSRKKVILYNTHMFSWVNGGKEYFEKIQTIFELFCSRDDMVLWWRPHPNTEMNFRIKRPKWLGAYKQIVDGYKCGGWGIYDESPDLHRAIAWNDAYYGDWSSLVALFGVTGKPIVIQDVSAIENDVLLRFADFTVDDGGGVWAFELFNDGLFKLDFKNNTAEFMAKSGCTPLYKGKSVQTHRCINIHCVGEKVVCFPYFLDDILIFNQKNETSEKIQINCDYILPFEYEGFALWFCVEFQGKLYSFGWLSKAVVVLDTHTHKVSYNTTLFEFIGLLTDNEKHVKYPLYMSKCSEDGKITLLMRNCQHLIRYTLPTQEIEFLLENPIIAKCVYADFDGQDFWLIAEKNEKLIRWNPDTNKVAEYCMSNNGFVFPQDDSVFYGISDCGDFLLLVPGTADKILKFDKKTEQFIEYSEMPVPIDNDGKIIKYDRPKGIGNKIYAFARYNYTIYELDKLTGEITPHQFRLDEKDKNLYYSNYFDNLSATVKDSGLGDIAEFFACSINEKSEINLERRDSYLNISANKDGTAGEKIYEYVKSKMEVCK